MASFTLTLGTEATENSTIDTFPAGFPSAVVLNAAPSRTIVVGDYVTDSAAKKYLITAVTSQTEITVIDHLTSGNGSTGGGNTGRAYVGADAGVLAEADIGNYAGSGDSVTWNCMNDGVLTSKVAINDTTLGSGGTLTITSPVGERHTGTAGTGLIMDPSVDGAARVARHVHQGFPV